MPIRFDGFVVPDDSPPSPTAIKRQVLFFDSITLVHPEDAALINENEVQEKFSKLTFTWAPRNHFPRIEGYEDAYLKLISDTSALQKRGIVRVVRKLQKPREDPGMNHVLWATAIPNQKLVEASAPDRDPASKPKIAVTNYMDGIMVQDNERSKYAVNAGRSYRFPDHPLEWSLLAHLRLGRALKFTRMAQSQSLVPLALDHINANILNALTVDRPAIAQDAGGADTTVAASLEIFDPSELDRALNNMSWEEVARLRKTVLPGVAKLRDYLHERSRKLHMSQEPSIEWARDQIRELQKGFDSEKEKLAEEWEKLRIVAVAKGGGVAAVGEVTGLISFFASASLGEFLVKMVMLGLVSMATLSQELKSLLPAQRKVLGHPLYFADNVRRELPR